ncbi:MAG: metallophosphoesterase [Candidatus Natronoplasma sp.]
MKIIDKILDDGIKNVSEEEYLALINKAKNSLENKNLVEKDEGEFFVVGDTHGNLEAARKPAERALEEDIPIVYLGDYVDRGEKQLENLAYVLFLKIQEPEKVILLRGNHETESMNQKYGFLREVNRRYSIDLFQEILYLYEKMPVAALLGEEYFSVHGGIPRGVTSLSKIDELDHDDDSYKEMFWNDPSEDIWEFAPNRKRGGFELYGEGAVEDFLEENGLSMVIRAHEVHRSGYKYYFDKKLLSIFSVSNYRGGNQGKFAHVKGSEIELINNP